MFSTGVFINSPLNFDSLHWNDHTDTYIELINTSLNEERWNQIFRAVHDILKKGRSQGEGAEESMEAGPSAEGFYIPDSDPPLHSGDDDY